MKKPLALALISGLTVAASAQTSVIALAETGSPGSVDWVFDALGHPGLAALAGRELAGEPVVKGAPFCANRIYERVQPLADGNRIVQRQTGLYCRDGEGRTRREVQREGGKRVIYLHDPVSRESWVIDPEGKSSRRIVAHRSLESRAGEGGEALAERMREHGERMREWAQDFSRRMREQFGAEPRQGVKGSPPLETRVIRIASLGGSDEAAGRPHILPLGLAGGPDLWLRGPGSTSLLPASEIDGIKVNGERTTWTLEAGKIGNERALVSTREVWRSPELGVVLSSQEHDPRSGEVSTRLERIQRGEPDPALMKPPARPEAKS